MQYATREERHFCVVGQTTKDSCPILACAMEQKIVKFSSVRSSGLMLQFFARARLGQQHGKERRSRGLSKARATSMRKTEIAHASMRSNCMSENCISLVLCKCRSHIFDRKGIQRRVSLRLLNNCS